MMCLCNENINKICIYDVYTNLKIYLKYTRNLCGNMERKGNFVVC